MVWPLPARPRIPTSTSWAIIERPGVAGPAATAALAFAGIAGEPLAMLLVVRDATGSFAFGGLVAAAYGAAAGIFAPARGRTLDRRGMRALVPIAGWHFVALMGLLLATQLDAPLAAHIRIGPSRAWSRRSRPRRRCSRALTWRAR